MNPRLMTPEANELEWKKPKLSPWRRDTVKDSRDRTKVLHMIETKENCSSEPKASLVLRLENSRLLR